MIIIKIQLKTTKGIILTRGLTWTEEDLDDFKKEYPDKMTDRVLLTNMISGALENIEAQKLMPPIEEIVGIEFIRKEV